MKSKFSSSAKFFLTGFEQIRGSIPKSGLVGELTVHSLCIDCALTVPKLHSKCTVSVR